MAGLTYGIAQNEAPANAQLAGPKFLEVVLDVKRMPDTDILILRTGEKLTGSFPNQTFRFKAAYADLEIPARMIAGIDLEGEFSTQEAIVTVNGNRFSGFLHEPAFVLRQDDGSQIEVRREKVAKAIMRVRGEEREGTQQQPSNSLTLRLKNGDVLSGVLLEPPVLVDANNAKVPFQLKDAETIALSHGKTHRAVVRLRNGELLQGALEAEDIDLQLELGPRIRIYLGRLDLIDCRAETFVDRLNPPPAEPADGAAAGRSSLDRAKDREGLVWISPGTFLLGSPPDEADRGLDEGPQVKVTINHGYWIGKWEVTQAQYRAIMGNNPSHFTGDANRPVEKVSWQDALEYCARLTAMEQGSGKLPDGFAYRLPTEAEWEYACRAGTTTRFSYGDDLGYAQLGSYAWFTGNSGSTTSPVGTRRPNPWGLYDMHGNVWEWCLDHWAASATPNEGQDDGRGSLRTARGGSWLYDGRFCRSANRDDYFKSNRCSDLGFRVVLAPLRP